MIPRPRPISGLALDAALVKRVKSVCKRARCNALSACELLWEHLEAQHAETRLLALLLWDVLFCRSAAFREATAARIQEFVLLTIGDDRRSDASLPPPRDAAAALRARAIEMFEGWHDAHAARVPAPARRPAILRALAQSYVPQGGGARRGGGGGAAAARGGRSAQAQGRPGRAPGAERGRVRRPERDRG